MPSGMKTIWQCQENQCSNDRSLVGYSYSEGWGRCLHVGSVNESSSFRLSPPKPYPASAAGKVHREVVFNVQG